MGKPPPTHTTQIRAASDCLCTSCTQYRIVDEEIVTATAITSLDSGASGFSDGLEVERESPRAVGRVVAANPHKSVRFFVEHVLDAFHVDAFVGAKWEEGGTGNVWIISWSPRIGGLTLLSYLNLHVQKRGARPRQVYSP